MISKKGVAPPEAHLQIKPIEPDRARDITEYATTMLPGGSRISKMQFVFLEKYFELEYDGPKAVILAGFRTEDPTRKANILLAIPAIAEEIIRRMTMKRRQFNLELNDIEEELWSSARSEGDGTSHNARVSALGHLYRGHGGFDKGNDKSKKVPVVVNIGFGSIYDDDKPEPKVLENDNEE